MSHFWEHIPLNFTDAESGKIWKEYLDFWTIKLGDLAKGMQLIKA